MSRAIAARTGCAPLCTAAFIASFAFCPTNARADSAVEEIVVTASRNSQPLSQVPASVSIVSADQIRSTPALALNDILRQVPGMSLNMVGPDVAHPTAYNEGMRGLPTTETRFLVLADGIPINDPFFGYIQWNRIPLNDIDHVEIVRGGGSPLWGNAAMGGVVQVITHAPDSGAVDLDAAGGSYGTYRASANAAYAPVEWLKLSVNAAFSGTDGYQTTPAAWTSFGTTTIRSPVYTPTSFDARNLALRGTLTPGDGYSGFFTINYHDNNQVLSTSIGQDYQTTWTYAGGVTKRLGDGGSISLTFFHDDSRFVTDNPHLLTFTTEYNSNIHRTPVEDNGASLIWSQDFAGILRNVTLGADMHAIAGADEADYFLTSNQLAVPTILGKGKQLFLGAFGQIQTRPIERLEVDASLRYQFYRNYDAIDTFPPAIGAIPSSHIDSVDPRVNLRYELTDAIALRGAYYRSFRAPTLDQLYRTYADTTAGIFEGNPFLKPETLEGGEVGFDFVRPGFRSQVTFYTTTIDNLITQRNLTPAESPTVLGVTCGFDPTTFSFLTCTRNINAASALARGIEVEAGYDLAPGLAAHFAYTYADSHYTANPEDPTAVGQRLEGVPRHNVAAGLSYSAPGGWRVATDLRWVSISYGDPHPEDGLVQNAHFVVDVSAAYPIMKNVEAYLEIQNLTDQRYIAQNGGGAPILGTPFQALSGVRIRF